ncbi:MAG: chemotaxis-specific protein-glutamate methyltransferase CheB [Betaproteobacteria bacterium]|nr:chemotaxis-specific protein-glutamate methyltransferase CheB [Betaproteobacteria bacterium]
MNSQLQNGSGRKIRLLLVDDSPLSIEIIRRMLATSPEIEIVGAAGNGREALELIPKILPDVIVTDLHMPTMDGLAMTREVMARHPLPILVLSVSVQADQTHNIFRILEAGALDILAKPRGGLAADFGITAHDLIQKIRILAGVKVIRRHRPALEPIAEKPASPLPGFTGTRPRIIGIGASTGGPQALQKLLGGLPADFALPILCVQHIAHGFLQGLVQWLAGGCRIAVRIAEQGALPLSGVAYFPPDDRHLEIDDSGRFRCSASVPLAGHRPSVDIALSSLARYHRDSAAGVLLTGMGQDGAQGMQDIARAGGLTIAQDEETSVVFGMPRRAIELGAARLVLPIEQIAPALIEAASSADCNGVTRS